MIRPAELQFLTPAKAARLLAVLFAIHEAPDTSQHKIAAATDLSSSMVNNYVRWLKKEGYINVQGKTNRTLRYHLSAAGQVLMREYLLEYSAEIVRLYSTAKEEIANILSGFYDEGIRTIVLFGVAETAEIVFAAFRRTQLVIIGVVDSDAAKQGTIFNGMKIQSPDCIQSISPDAVVITSFGKQEEIFAQVRSIAGDEIQIKKLSDV